MKEFLAFLLMLTLCGCSTAGTNASSAPSEESAKEKQRQEQNGKTAVVYFTWPENGEDTNSSASIVMKDGQKQSATQYAAEIIASQTDGTLIAITPKDTYPMEHEALVDQASAERQDDARPEITNDAIDWNEYDTVYLGYPIWWSDLPMPVYTFLEQNDLSGKTIRLFITHGGSGSAGTEETIQELEPGANVSEDILVLSRNEVSESEEEIENWVNE